MISPDLYKKSRTYDFFLKLLGYEGSIARFLKTLEIDCPNDCRILDSGCGTGLLGLHFLTRFESATLTATDLEANFLDAVLANADKREIDRQRITLGTADISDPCVIELTDGTSKKLTDESFDLICVGAVVGYARDTEISIQKLLAMLAPGGYLINIEMNESPTGRFVSRRFHYSNISIARMQDVVRDAGCTVQTMKFRVTDLPAKFTRTAVVARKPPATDHEST